MAEVLWGEGAVRAGGSWAIGAVSNAGQDASNAFSALGASLWVGFPTGLGPSLSLRAGGFAGGQKGGLIGGAWLSPGVSCAFSLGERLRLRLLAEMWVLQRRDTTWLLSPGLGLAW